MDLELLPNEILVDLFHYFNDIDLLRAFYNLNLRFNLLLYKQFRFYCFNYKCCSKRNFDMICQQHLPFIANRVIAVTLSNYKQTPEQINLFLSYIPSLHQFTHLRSLVISQLCSYETLLKLLHQFCHLNSLTHLTLYSCSFSNTEATFQLIIDRTWSLPKLANCFFSIQIKEQELSSLPTIISSSLKYLTICSSKFNMAQINRLFEYTPHLKHLSIDASSIDNDYIASPLSMLNITSIDFSCSFDYSQIVVVLQNIPNLRHLTINVWSELIINGHQWEQIIHNYLPKLKTFQLKMRITLLYEPNIQEQANRLTNSFRSSFWIDQRQWFVRCRTTIKSIELYTLRNTYRYYGSRYFDSWQSTYPHDNQQEFYNTVTSFYDEKFFNQAISSGVCLPNIKHLATELPLHDQFWSVVPDIDQLDLLTVSSFTDSFQSQLQTLLNRTPHLRILELNQDASLPLQVSLFKYTNRSVRQIDLHKYNHCFSEEECLIISSSPLGIQCEVLSIQVNHRKSITNLVENMTNLRSLHVLWNEKKNFEHLNLVQDDDEYLNRTTETLRQLVQWLKEQLPSTCSVVNDLQYDDNHISIWI